MSAVVQKTQSSRDSRGGLPGIRMLIGGSWRNGAVERDVIDPYRGEVIARAPESAMADLDDALKAAVAARPLVAGMPGYERAALLRRVADRLVARAEEIAETMSRETGKAIKDARTEVVRSQDTINLSAEEAICVRRAVPDGWTSGAHHRHRACQGQNCPDESGLQHAALRAVVQACDPSAERL